jgi:multicomponent Na+:H+ antiporter subunit D
MMIAAGVTAGTLLRAWARVFLGWGPRGDELLTHEPEEDPAEQRSFVPLMRATAAVALALGLVVSVVPGLERRTDAAANRFVDRTALEAQVLYGAEPAAPPRLAHDIPPPSGASVAYGIGSAVLALAVAAFGLWRGRLPFSLRRPAWRALGPPIGVVRAAHSGIVGDYVLWIVAGTALIGAVWAFTLT